MPIENSAAGLVVRIKGSLGNNPVDRIDLVYSNNAKSVDVNGPDTNFRYGMFPSALTLLLIAAKNKFSMGQDSLVPGIASAVTQVDVLGLFVKDDRRNLEEYLPYSTLPLVYICDNSLGTGRSSHQPHGKAIPIFFDYNDQARTLSRAEKQIVLDRQSGAFAVVDVPSPVLSVTGHHHIDVSGLAPRYNKDFLADGLGGTILDQLAAINPDAIPMQRKGRSFATVLSDIADRWTEHVVKGQKAADKFHYNIGAALYLRRVSKQESDLYALLARSLNIKADNKAAHAEVRIAFVLDFLSAIYFKGTNNFQVSGLDALWTPAKLRQLAANVEMIRKSGMRLVLFSSLLPCYMCQGAIEATDLGRIVTINGLPVDLWSGFVGAKSTFPITDTFYYDIDAEIDYREMEAVDYAVHAKTHVSIRPVSIRSHIPSTGRIVSFADARIDAYPIAVFEAGHTTFGIGLQNSETTIRYRLAAEVLKIASGEEAAQIVNLPAVQQR